MRLRSERKKAQAIGAQRGLFDVYAFEFCPFRSLDQALTNCRQFRETQLKSSPNASPRFLRSKREQAWAIEARRGLLDCGGQRNLNKVMGSLTVRLLDCQMYCANYAGSMEVLHIHSNWEPDFKSHLPAS